MTNHQHALLYTLFEKDLTTDLVREIPSISYAEGYFDAVRHKWSPCDWEGGSDSEDDQSGLVAFERENILGKLAWWCEYQWIAPVLPTNDDYVERLKFDEPPAFLVRHGQFGSLQSLTDWFAHEDAWTLLRQTIHVFPYIVSRATPEMCMFVVQEDGMMLQFIPEHLLTSELFELANSQLSNRG